jgi:SNF2 family DNA or RNA helicase
MDHFEAFALPAQLELPLRSMASLPQQLLTHIRVACGAGASLPGKRDDKHALSTKMQQLLKDLRHIMQEANTGDGSTGKAVVFSNHKEAISHCTQVLEDQQIGCVRIMKGDTADEVRNAVLRWNRDPECRVFLCHVGAAAAGLTLTAARHCFILEPCQHFGEEAQAMNRCHRIGQARQVEVVMYYMRDSVEERILAYRKMKGEPILPSAGYGMEDGNNSDDLSVLQDSSNSQVTMHKLNYFLGIGEANLAFGSSMSMAIDLE